MDNNRPVYIKHKVIYATPGQCCVEYNPKCNQIYHYLAILGRNIPDEFTAPLLTPLGEFLYTRIVYRATASVKGEAL